MVTKRMCLDKLFSLGQVMLHFTTFIMFLYIREMAIKARNDRFVFDRQLVLDIHNRKLKVGHFGTRGRYNY